MRFNLSHIVLDPPLHGLLGYREVIESIEWGLKELGHEVTIQINGADAAAVNIIFGAQLLSPTVIAELPADSIVYNLEQISHKLPSELGQAYRAAAGRLQFWDYSEANVKVLNGLAPNKPPLHVPIGWAPVLERIPKPAVQDIDVLLYGVPSQARLNALVNLTVEGATVAYVCGLYGSSRDSLIARAKIVANVRGVHANSHIFEVVRASYLLINAKAVVSDVYPDSIMEDDLREGVAFVPLEMIAKECMRLIKDDAARAGFERAGPQVMRRRDIRKPLKRALENLAVR